MAVQTQSSTQTAESAASPARTERSAWAPSFSRSSTLSEIDDVLDDVMSDVVAPEPSTIDERPDSVHEFGDLDQTPRPNKQPSGSPESNLSSPSSIVTVVLQNSTSDDRTNIPVLDLDEGENEEGEIIEDDPPVAANSAAKGTKESRTVAAGASTDNAGLKRKRKLLPSSGDDDLAPRTIKRTQSGYLPKLPLVAQEAAKEESGPSQPTTEPSPEGEASKEYVQETPAAPEEPPTESSAPTPRTPRPRKGKRKSKRLDGRQGGDGDDEVDEEDEEDDGSVIQEGALKRMFAQELLNNIERQFATFRGKYINEQLDQINHELEQLRKPQNDHSEYLIQMRPIDNRFCEKADVERRLYKYRKGILRVRLVADCTQLHSQYVQDVREMRAKSMEAGYEFFHALQRDRRRWGADETIHVHMFDPRRSKQIRDQIAYNREVSILSGLAKHVGFPAAPDLPGLQDREIADDLEEMGIRPSTASQSAPASAVSGPLQQPSFLPTTWINKNEAEEQFLEQTPWANPDHPSHTTNSFHHYAPNGNPAQPPPPPPPAPRHQTQDTRPGAVQPTFSSFSQPVEDLTSSPTVGLKRKSTTRLGPPAFEGNLLQTSRGPGITSSVSIQNQSGPAFVLHQLSQQHHFPPLSQAPAGQPLLPPPLSLQQGMPQPLASHPAPALHPSHYPSHPLGPVPSQASLQPQPPRLQHGQHPQTGQFHAQLNPRPLSISHHPHPLPPPGQMARLPPPGTSFPHPHHQLPVVGLAGPLTSPGQPLSSSTGGSQAGPGHNHGHNHSIMPSPVRLAGVHTSPQLPAHQGAGR